MFDNIKRDIMKVFSFYVPYRDWDFCLTGYYEKKRVEIYITLHEDGKISLKIQNGIKVIKNLSHIDKNDPFLEEIITSEAYKDVMKEINKYEQKMKENMKIKDVQLLGKKNDNTLAIAFMIDHDVLEDKYVYFDERVKEISLVEYQTFETLFVICVKRDNGKFTFDKEYSVRTLNFFDVLSNSYLTSLNSEESFESLSEKRSIYFPTHQNYFNDLVDILLKEKSIRVKLLVN